MKTLLAAAVLLAACGHDDPVDNTMAIGVYQLKSGCGARVTSSDEISVKPSFDVCDSAATPILAGTDTLTLVIDYGDLEFTEGTDVPAPTVSVAVDGVPVTVTQNVLAKREGEHAFFEVTFIAPPHPNGQLEISAQAVVGYARTIAAIPLAAASLTISVENCAQAPCSLTAAVDTAAVHIRAATPTMETVALTQYVDGVSQAMPLMVPLTPTGSGVEGIAYLAVPTAEMWSFHASDGAAMGDYGPITLTNPMITGTLACGATCKTGTTTTLQIIAPRHIHPAVASVSINIDGTITSATVNLTTEDEAKMTVSGVLSVPLSGKTLSIDANVAGYAITTITTAISQ